MLNACRAATLLLLAPLTACGSGSGTEATSPTSTSSPSGTAPEAPAARTSDEPAPSTKAEPPGRGTRIVTSGSEFGTMLFDRTGQAIYLFDVETTSRPRCYDACAEAWPPVLTTGDPVAGPGIERRLLGTTERTDGSLQVTYNGHPLYFYAHEDKGEVECHDIFLNGGTWYVVRPSGAAAPPG